MSDGIHPEHSGLVSFPNLIKHPFPSVNFRALPIRIIHTFKFVLFFSYFC
ncbi:hypothetical protein DFO77_10558 [Marinilabilia salmonicolor]|uniref:Uncharacterized protein n=1 Tax=Marinilabilia salmonicolor TaxID=989 RepID=A0A2T0XBV5_9BACT|nr:hypothetical protein BY457_11521 [Marinilabilia salmonicolor]RCW37550.1 hypothetical protein DFO77_10558 [Marinilabilia salmonicolor]